jgi:type IV pilus assembly protein PilY1
VGTGKFLDTSDDSTTQIQTMYAMQDGTKTAPTTTGLPLTRTSLTAVSGVGTMTAVTTQGWYNDFTAGERVTIDPSTNQGVVAWVTSTPSSDACAPGASGTIYAREFNSGYSRLLQYPAATIAVPNPLPVPVGSITSSVAIVKLQVVNVQGTNVGLATDALGNIITPPANLGAKPQVGRVNWREIFDQ